MKISKLKARAESLGLLLEPVLLGGFWLIDREGMESRFGKAHEIEKHLVYFAENGRFPEQNGRQSGVPHEKFLPGLHRG